MNFLSFILFTIGCGLAIWRWSTALLRTRMFRPIRWWFQEIDYQALSTALKMRNNIHTLARTQYGAPVQSALREVDDLVDYIASVCKALGTHNIKSVVGRNRDGSHIYTWNPGAGSEVDALRAALNSAMDRLRETNYAILRTTTASANLGGAQAASRLTNTAVDMESVALAQAELDAELAGLNRGPWAGHEDGRNG